MKSAHAPAELLARAVTARARACCRRRVDAQLQAGNVPTWAHVWRLVEKAIARPQPVALTPSPTTAAAPQSRSTVSEETSEEKKSDPRARYLATTAEEKVAAHEQVEAFIEEAEDLMQQIRKLFEFFLPHHCGQVWALGALFPNRPRPGQGHQRMENLMPPLAIRNDSPYRYSMRTTCKNPDCGKQFTPERAGALYCSGACRIAAFRKRQQPLPVPMWTEIDKHDRLRVPRFSTKVRLNHDGTTALSQGELGERLLDIAKTGDDGKPKTGRRFFYLALSHGDIVVDMSDTPMGKKSRTNAYKRILRVLGTLRKMGRIDWEDVLDLTCELDQWRIYGSPREARARLREVYDEDRWLGQLYFPIFIVEKDTMVPVCRPMAANGPIPFASSRGYGSLTLQFDVAKTIKQRYAQTGQWGLIYFISDHDPSGFGLQASWEEAMLNFAAPVHEFRRIALTTEQVHNVDLDIARLSVEVKSGDKRSRKYREEHGDRCWETDILPAAVIEQALDFDIHSWLDEKKWRQRAREIERARALL